MVTPSPDFPCPLCCGGSSVFDEHKDDCEDDDEQEEYEDQENEMMLMLMLMLMLMTMLLLLMMMMMMGARRWELGQQMFARVSMGEG